VRIVVDTNVYISSLLFKGKAREAYDICIASSDVFISDFIIAELSGKLHTKFAIPVSTVKEIIASILSVIEKVKVTSPLPTVCRDSDDNNILQLCESVAADFLITGDKDLLYLVEFKSTKIVNPADFMKLVN
jgi:putative PIN family toxin of toxin-antitoxin system